MKIVIDLLLKHIDKHVENKLKLFEDDIMVKNGSKQDCCDSNMMRAIANQEIDDRLIALRNATES